MVEYLTLNQDNIGFESRAVHFQGGVVKWYNKGLISLYRQFDSAPHYFECKLMNGLHRTSIQLRGCGGEVPYKAHNLETPFESDTRNSGDGEKVSRQSHKLEIIRVGAESRSQPVLGKGCPPVCKTDVIATS